MSATHYSRLRYGVKGKLRNFLKKLQKKRLTPSVRVDTLRIMADTITLTNPHVLAIVRRRQAERRDATAAKTAASLIIERDTLLTMLDADLSGLSGDDTAERDATSPSG